MTRKLLIVSPGFHGYYQAIGRAFDRLDYDVALHCYDAAGRGEKAWNKVRWELPSRLGGADRHLSAQRVSRRALAAVRSTRPDVVLVVRGDVLGEEFWAGVAAHGCPAAVWMYDELRRTVFDAEMVSQYAGLATYSASDTAALRSRGMDALHVPLGFDDTVPSAESADGAGVFSFIGAPLPGREKALAALLRAGLPVRAWGRGWSDHPMDRARTWRLHGRDLPNGRDVPGPLAHTIMRNSIATLNVHGDQDGFTMRTFEACGAGAVQLVDRADVVELYEPDRELITFGSDDELIDQARRIMSRPSDFRAMREAATKRTLAEHTLTHRVRDLQRLWQ